METTRTSDKDRLRRDWGKEAINRALKGEWERAAEVNQAILALYPDDVEAMNRLGKALMEQSEYEKARQVLSTVVEKAPYNTIARKNLARLEQMESAPANGRPANRAASTPRLFIAESGKSGTTVLQRPAGAGPVTNVAPGEPVSLEVKNNSILVYAREEEFIGRVESRLSGRLSRLIAGGNMYEAAVVGISDWGITIIIRETYRHPSLHNIASFPTNSRGDSRPNLRQDLLKYLEDSDLDDEEDGAVIDYVGVGESDSEWDE
ncbi:MAG: tetratricopeptide repeat protein [Chloroflexi bacterium]|nr:tetratricopeptide repeat protein [Chloroflexota bacterium]